MCIRDSLGVGGGIVVTASHNPKDYNGMKFVREGARPISGDSGLAEIRALAEANDFTGAETRGSLAATDTQRAYVEHLLSYIDVSALKPLGLTAALCGVGYGAVSALGGSSEAISALSLGVEPANALSFPTWMVHVSSVSEWCAAMALAWRLGEVGPNSAWKGFSLSMAPSLAGALTACTIHLYYNSPSLAALVPLQAALTLVGKASCICAKRYKRYNWVLRHVSTASVIETCMGVC